MQVEIEYCGMGGYEPRARKVREMMLTTMPSAEIQLRKSGGGVFEITVNGKLAFSKKATGRFPTDEEVLGTLASGTDQTLGCKGSALPAAWRRRSTIEWCRKLRSADARVWRKAIVAGTSPRPTTWIGAQ